ncbi:MAG: hypothetical protein AAF998_10515 [Bacteroidota bacterium]
MPKSAQIPKGETATVQVIQNREKDGVELHFSTDPGKDMLARVRAKGFRPAFRAGKAYWWAKQNKQTLRFARSLERNGLGKTPRNSITIQSELDAVVAQSDKLMAAANPPDNVEQLLDDLHEQRMALYNELQDQKQREQEQPKSESVTNPSKEVEAQVDREMEQLRKTRPRPAKPKLTEGSRSAKIKYAINQVFRELDFFDLFPGSVKGTKIAYRQRFGLDRPRREIREDFNGAGVGINVARKIFTDKTQGGDLDLVYAVAVARITKPEDFKLIEREGQQWFQVYRGDRVLIKNDQGQFVPRYVVGFQPGKKQAKIVSITEASEAVADWDNIYPGDYDPQGGTTIEKARPESDLEQSPEILPDHRARDSRDDWQRLPSLNKYANYPKATDFKLERGNKGLRKIFSFFAAKDTDKGVLKGMKFDQGGVAATDAHKLFWYPGKLKASEKNTWECLTCSKDQDIRAEQIKQGEEGKYPDFQHVIPANHTHIHSGVSVKALLRYAHAINQSIWSASGPMSRVDFIFGGEMVVAVNGKLLEAVCTALLVSGIDRVYLSASSPKRPVIFSTERPIKDTAKMLERGPLALLMPIMIGGFQGSQDNQGRPSGNPAITEGWNLEQQDFEFGFNLYFDLEVKKVRTHHHGKVVHHKIDTATSLQDAERSQRLKLWHFKALAALEPKRTYIIESLYVQGGDLHYTVFFQSLTVHNTGLPDGDYVRRGNGLIQIPDQDNRDTYRVTERKPILTTTVDQLAPAISMAERSTTSDGELSEILFTSENGKATIWSSDRYALFVKSIGNTRKSFRYSIHSSNRLSRVLQTVKPGDLELYTGTRQMGEAKKHTALGFSGRGFELQNMVDLEVKDMLANIGPLEGHYDRSLELSRVELSRMLKAWKSKAADQFHKSTVILKLEGEQATVYGSVREGQDGKTFKPDTQAGDVMLGKLEVRRTQFKYANQSGWLVLEGQHKTTQGGAAADHLTLSPPSAHDMLPRIKGAKLGIAYKHGGKYRFLFNPAATTARTRTTANKGTTTKPNKPTMSVNDKTFVEQKDIALKLMRSFTNLDGNPRKLKSGKERPGKPKTQKTTLNLLKRLQREIKRGNILSGKKRGEKHATPFWKEMEYIQSRLVWVLNNAYETDDLDETKLLLFDKKKIAKYRNLTDGFAVYPSVTYSLRFIGMQGKAVPKEQAERLLNQIKADQDKGLIEDGPAAGDIPAITKALQKYIKGDDKVLKLQKRTLEGLTSTLQGCGCQVELEGHTSPSYYQWTYWQERDEFAGWVSDRWNNTVFAIQEPEQMAEFIEDGFMRHVDDLEGLEEYLKAHQIITQKDQLIGESEDFPPVTFDGDLGGFGARSAPTVVTDPVASTPSLDPTGGGATTIKSNGATSLDPKGGTDPSAGSGGQLFPTGSNGTATNSNTTNPDGTNTIISPPKGQALTFHSNKIPDLGDRTYNFTGAWEGLFNKPSIGFSALIFGPPKSGKSTMALGMAGYLARNFGTVLYSSIEEGIRSTMAERIQRLGVEHHDLIITNHLPADLAAYDFVIIDSLSRGNLDISAMRRLITRWPNTSFFFLAHVTKDGLPRGTREFEHEVDVLVNVKDGQAVADGRYGPGEMKVIFESKEANQ